MIQRIVLACVIAVALGIVLVGLLGPLLTGLNVPIAANVGKFFVSYGWVIATLAGLWFFFASGTFRRSGPPP